MAHANSFTRMNILAFFLLATILFSSVADLNNEAFAISKEITITAKIVEKTAVHHSINLSESMGLSTPEEKKNSETTSVDEKNNNLTSISFEEDLHFKSDTSQTESSTIFVKQFSDRNGMIERILPIDRLRSLDKPSTKNYLDSDLQSFSNDNYLSNFIDYFSADLFNSINVISELKLDDIESFKLDTNDSTGIVFLALISSLIFVRSENHQIKFDSFKKLFSYGFILLLISSAVISPASISSSYWGVAYGEEMENTNSSNNNVENISTDYTNDTLPLESSNFSSTIPEDSNDFSLPEIIYNNTSVNSTIEDVEVVETNNLIVENYTEPIIENYTDPIIENYTEPIIENYTDPIIENYTDPIIENYTDPIIENYTDPIIIPNATESWEFDSIINGSQFIGNVHLDNETGLVLDGEGYVSNDGNSTNNISNLTITAWVKPYYANGSAELTVVSKENTFELTINNVVDPQRVANISIFDGIQRHSVESLTTFGENWSHIAITFNGTLLSMYTNGTLSNEKTITDTIILTSDGQLEPKTPELVTSSSDVVVGASLDNTRTLDEVSKKFSGKIQYVNIFDVYLSAEQIYQIYNSTFPLIVEITNSTDIDTTQINSTNDIPIEEIETIDVLEDITSIEIDNSTGIDNLSNYTQQDTSIELNGTESFLSIEEEELNEELNQLTLSTFVKPDYSTGSDEFVILSKENSFTLSLNNNISPEHLAKFSVFDGISWTEVTGLTQIEEWSHLVAIINHTTISLYVNGTLEGTEKLSEPILVSGDQIQITTSDVMTTDSDLVIGAYPSTTRGQTTLSNHFSGLIDDILIYKEILNESQINEIYSKFIEQQKLELELSLIVPIKIQNITSTLNHTEIIIGESVNWTHTIESEDDILNIEVEIPADAQNIQVEIFEQNNEALEIPQAKMDIIQLVPTLESDKAERVLLESASMDKIDQVFQEDKDTKLVVINENATEYLLEFETPAPYTTEEDNSSEDMFNKTVTVAHDSALHYTDVRSYSDLPEDLVHDGMEFSLFWNVNGSKTDVTNDPKFQVEFVDTNNNGINDRMFWTVPQLSEQEFEIIGGSSSQSSSTACQDIFLDFEGIPHGAPLSYINDLPQFKDNGIILTTLPHNDAGPFNTFIIFDSDESGTSDWDLEVDEGNIIIIQENDYGYNPPDDVIFDDPDDYASGGIQVYEFDHPRIVKSFVFVDHDNNNFARATAYDAENNVIKYVNIPNGGEKSVQTIAMNAANTVRLEIEYQDSGAMGPIDLSCSAQGTVTLNGLIRDFKDSHPDFQHVIGDDDGIVEELLGNVNGAEPDNPAHVEVGATVTTTSAENYNQWYENVEDINICQEYDITLSPNNDGLFEFSDSNFFPIDGELFGNQGRNHNYHFTFEMRGLFEFEQGQTIQVNGDDDIWIFVNHTLIYDGGGVLPPRDSGLLELDDFNLNLIEGEEYDIDIFFAERHTVMSVLEIETNINIIQKNLSCDPAQNFETILTEILDLNDSELIVGTPFSTELLEPFLLSDETLVVAKNGFFQLALSEMLDFTDDEIAAKSITEYDITLEEPFSLTDETLLVAKNGIFQLALSEMLDFVDEEVDTKSGTAYTTMLEEPFSLTDETLLVAKNGIFQLALSEMLDFTDDEIDSVLGTTYTTTLEETLSLTDETLLVAKNGIFQLALSEMLDFVDEEVDTKSGTTYTTTLEEPFSLSDETLLIIKNGAFQLPLFEMLDFTDDEIDTSSGTAHDTTLEETLSLADDELMTGTSTSYHIFPSEILHITDETLLVAKNGIFQLALSEMLDFVDEEVDTKSGIAHETFPSETLNLSDEEIFKELSISLDEILTFVDEELDTTKSTAYKAFPSETLNLSDEEIFKELSISLDEILRFTDGEIIKNIAYSSTLQEPFSLSDQTLLVAKNGIFQLALSEMLDFVDNDPAAKIGIPYKVPLTENLDLTDETLLVAKNGIIQLSLSEMLDFVDDELVTDQLTHAFLFENFELNDVAIKSNDLIEIDLDETLSIDDNSGFNAPPTAIDDIGTTNEDTLLSVSVPGVLGNDIDTDTGDTKTVTKVNGISSNVGTQITLGSGALLKLNSDGSYTYDPNGKFESLGVGASVIDSFTYTMSDSAGSSDSATVRITITGLTDIVPTIPPVVLISGGGGGGGGGGSPRGEGPGPGTDEGPGDLRNRYDADFKGFEIQYGKLATSDGGGCFIDKNENITVSVKIGNNSPLDKTVLKFYEEGNPNTIHLIPMDNITSNEDTLEKLSGTIPWDDMKNSDKITFWVYVTNEDGKYSESKRYTVDVKPGYTPLHDDLDSVIAQVEGSNLKGYAYITNSLSESARGSLTLIVNNTNTKVIENYTLQNHTNFDFKRGTTFVPFNYTIPTTWDDVEHVVDYQIKVVGEFCNRIFESEEITVSSFPALITKLLPVYSVDLLNNTDNIPIAGATKITSSANNPRESFTVISPNGTCVIGQEEDCKVKGNTSGITGARGIPDSNAETVTLDDGQIYSVKYSGPDKDYEIFTITSEDPIHGEWTIKGGSEGTMLYCYYEAIHQPEPSKAIFPELGLETPRFLVIPSTLPWWVYVAIVEIIAAIIIGVVATSRQNRYLFAAEVTIDLEGGVEK